MEPADIPAEMVVSLARAAGLEKALAAFPAAVALAISRARASAAAIAAPTDPAAEPWPPMVVPAGQLSGGKTR